jgi:hypothetical protein
MVGPFELSETICKSNATADLEGNRGHERRWYKAFIQETMWNCSKCLGISRTTNSHAPPVRSAFARAKAADAAGLNLRALCNITSQFSSAPSVEALEHLPPLLLRTAFD